MKQRAVAAGFSRDANVVRFSPAARAFRSRPVPRDRFQTIVRKVRQTPETLQKYARYAVKLAYETVQAVADLFTGALHF